MTLKYNHNIERSKDIMQTPKCLACANYISGSLPNTLKCKAFPDGVPEAYFVYSRVGDEYKICNNGIKYIDRFSGKECPVPEGAEVTTVVPEGVPLEGDLYIQYLPD